MVLPLPLAIATTEVACIFSSLPCRGYIRSQKSPKKGYLFDLVQCRLVPVFVSSVYFSRVTNRADHHCVLCGPSALKNQRSEKESLRHVGGKRVIPVPPFSRMEQWRMANGEWRMAKCDEV
jgi:hypothetical protein